MPKDFKASQIRTSALIGSGSSKSLPGMLVYSASDASDFEGAYQADMLTNVGSDVFLFVSGAKDTRTGVTLFGGDIVVSGSLYTENLIAEVDLSTTGSTSISGSLFVSSSATIGGGLTVNNADDASDGNAFTVVGEDESKFLIHANPTLGGQVFILSGGSPTSSDQTKAVDTNFFVSGSVGSRSTNVKGTSVFGGDVLISGTLYNSEGSVIGQGGGDAVGWFSGSSATHDDLGIQPNFISTSGSLAVSGTVHVASSISHIGDPDTLITFGDDEITAGAGGATQLAVRTSVVDVNSSGGNIDFTAGIQSGVVPNNPVGIKVDASTGQVLILSGGAKPSEDNATSQDVSFYVSGSKGTRSSDVRGTSVFGGDTVVSGALVVNPEKSDLTTTIFNNNDSAIKVNSSGVTINEGGHASNDFRIESDNNTYMFYVNSGDDRIGIGKTGANPDTTVHIKDSSPTLRIQRNSNSEDSTIDFAGALGNVGAVMHLSNSNDLVFKTHNGSSPEEMFRIGSHYGSLNRQIIFLSGSGLHVDAMHPKNAEDIAFFVSGAIGSKGTSVKGAAVFGGDVVVSGSLYGSKDSGFSNFKELNVVSDRVTFGNTSTNQIGNEVFFYVSGSTPTSGDPNPANALFDGPMVVSGNLSVLQNYPLTGSQVTLSNMSDAHLEGGSVQVKFRAGRSSGGSFLQIQKYGPNNPMISGGPHANVFMARSGSMVFMVGNPEDTSQLGNQPFVVRDMMGGTFFMLTTGSVATGDDLVYFLSGGAPTSNRLVGADTNFVVSGSIGSAGTVSANRGTALFGGDLVVSGGLSVDGTTLHVDQANSRVGVGTTAPDTLLHLKSTSPAKPVLKIENQQGGSNPVAIHLLRNTTSPADDDFIGDIHFRSMNDAGTPEEVLYAYITALSTDITDGSEDGELQFHTMKSGVATNTLTLQSGNAGIGVSDPDQKLEVAGAVHISGEITSPSAPSNGDGGILYVKADGKPYWISNEVSETDLTAGGGGSVTFTSGSTSAASTTSIDVARLGILNDYGGGSIAITGTIGAPEDGTYADGLFTTFQADTQIGHAIDKINEVLYYLAPSPAPNISNIGTDGKTGTTALLSLGSSTGVGSSGYTLVGGAAGLGAAVDVNQSYTVVTSSNNVRMGIFTAFETIRGELADGVTQNSYVNGVINHSGSAFGDADQGTLTLEVNGSTIQTIDLTSQDIGAGDPGEGTGTHVDGNSHGFIQLSQTGSAVQSNGQPFGLFQYRTGKFQVATGGGVQRQGWNYARVIHTVGSSARNTNYIEWFVDNAGVNPNANKVRIDNESLALSGSKYISGIQYATGAEGDYVVRIDNFYDHVYAQNSITFSTTNTDVIPSQTVPSLPASSGDQFSNQIELTGSFDIAESSINAGTMASGSATFNFSVSHPTKNNMTNTGSIESSRFLLYSASQLASPRFEDFVYEDYRLVSSSYDSQAALSTAISNGWNSTLHLTSSVTGQSDGLAFYAGKLVSPINTTDDNGNFTIFQTGYALDQGAGTNQPNYSSGGASDGQKTFYRYFKNESGAAVRDFKLSYTGSSTSLATHGTNITDNSSNVKVYVKLPGKSGWMDAGSAFVYPNISDYAGATMGTFSSAIGSSDTPVTHNITFGTASLGNNESIALKFVADAAWTGDMKGMNVVFPAVADGDVSHAPALDELDIASPGSFANGKLSFGAGKSSGGPSNYINVTGSSAAGGPYGVGSDVNFNGVYTSDTNAGSNKRYGILSSNGSVQIIKGNLNGDVNASGNSYTADAFSYAQTGTLELYVNQSGSGVNPVHTLTLANFMGEGNPGAGTAKSLNSNGSGFISASLGFAGADAAGLFDYRKIYRTAFFQVGASEQNAKGWNWAQVVHTGIPDQADKVTTFVEWVNDDDGNAVDIPSQQSGSFHAASYYHQSGVKYFNTAISPVATGTVRYRISDAYTNVYSNSSQALRFTTLNNLTAQGIFVTGRAITDTGDTSLSSNGTSMPPLLAGGDVTADILLTGTLTYTGGTSLPGDGSPLNSFTVVSPRSTLTVDHPIDSNAVQAVDFNNFLAYSGTFATSNPHTIEKFTGEYYRMQSGSFVDQAASGSLRWDSTQSLVGADSGHNDGLLIYGNDGSTGFLVSPKSSALPNGGDFRNFTDLNSPPDNVNYTGASGRRLFVRTFKNNTTSDQAVISLTVKGSATLVPEYGAGSASLGSNNNVYIFVKIPGKTGWLDVGRAADGTITDGGGALQGDRDASIDASGATNEVTFSTAFVGGDPSSNGSGEHFCLAIHADSNWTGHITEISVTF